MITALKPKVETGYIYVVVRDDLTNSQKAVQACHASMEATRNFIKNGDTHPHLVLCTVKGEWKLRELEYKLQDEGIGFKKFIEPDMDNQCTAIATEPLYGKARTFFKRFRLLK